MNGRVSEWSMPLGFHGDGVPVQGATKSLAFLTVNMPGPTTHAAMGIPLFFLLFSKPNFVSNMKQRAKSWRCSCGLCNA